MSAALCNVPIMRTCFYLAHIAVGKNRSGTGASLLCMYVMLYLRGCGCVGGGGVVPPQPAHLGQIAQPCGSIMTDCNLTPLAFQMIQSRDHTQQQLVGGEWKKSLGATLWQFELRWGWQRGKGVITPRIHICEMDTDGENESSEPHVTNY